MMSCYQLVMSRFVRQVVEYPKLLPHHFLVELHELRVKQASQKRQKIV
jgi:hypothetical protein